MGKSDEKLAKKRAHKAADSENKHKNKPSFDTLGRKEILMQHFIATLNDVTASNNCVNTRCSSATVSRHKSILPTPSLAHGFVISVFDTGSTAKKSQIL